MDIKNSGLTFLWCALAWCFVKYSAKFIPPVDKRISIVPVSPSCIANLNAYPWHWYILLHIIIDHSIYWRDICLDQNSLLQIAELQQNLPDVHCFPCIDAEHPDFCLYHRWHDCFSCLCKVEYHSIVWGNSTSLDKWKWLPALWHLNILHHCALLTSYHFFFMLSQHPHEL